MIRGRDHLFDHATGDRPIDAGDADPDDVARSGEGNEEDEGAKPGQAVPPVDDLLDRHVMVFANVNGRCSLRLVGVCLHRVFQGPLAIQGLI
jgi:hypothetical protein